MKRREREFWCNIYEVMKLITQDTWAVDEVSQFIFLSENDFKEDSMNQTLAQKSGCVFSSGFWRLRPRGVAGADLALRLPRYRYQNHFSTLSHFETTERNIWAQSTSSDPRLVQCELLHRGKQTLTPLSSSNHAVLWSALLWQIHKSSNIETW